MTTSHINAYRWPARLVSHKPFAAERYFITSSSIWQVFFCRKLRFFFFIFSVLSTAAFSVQDAQSQRFLPVENSPAPLCSISMGGKGGGYTYYIGNSLRQSLSALPAPSGREPTLSGPSRENGLPERPQTLRQSEIINVFSLAYGQAISNHFFFSCSSSPSRGVM